MIKRKGHELYVKWKGYNNSFKSWINKKDSINQWIFSWTEIFRRRSKYFPEPKCLGGKVKDELDLSNHATKRGLKNAAGIDLSSFAKKVDLANLNSYVDKLDIDKLKNLPTNLNNLKNKADKLDVDKLVPVPVDLSKLSDVVKNDVRKDVYNTKIKNIEDKIPELLT